MALRQGDGWAAPCTAFPLTTIAPTIATVTAFTAFTTFTATAAVAA
jgi:hypothetical protein